MYRFQDSRGRSWEIDLSIGHVMRVKSVSGYNLFEPDSKPKDKDTLHDLILNDLPTFWEVLWHLLEPQAKEQGVDAEAFGLAMAGRCLVDAQDQFLQAWSDFFQSLRQPHHAMGVKKAALYQKRAVEMVEARLQKDPTLQGLDERVTAKIEEALNASSGKLRASLESILEDTPSES